MASVGELVTAKQVMREEFCLGPSAGRLPVVHWLTKKAARVLVVSDTSELQNRVIRSLPKRAGMPPLEHKVWGRFLFKTADWLADFGFGWKRVDGSTVNLPT